MPAQILLVAAGITPNIDLAKDAKLSHNRGVLVDDRMCTVDPAIFAAGDVAEWNGELPGLWPTAVAQAEVAAENVVGGEKVYTGVVPVTILKVVGIELASIGRIHSEDGDEAIVHEGTGRYRKLLVRDGRMVGAILLGPGNDVAAVRTAITATSTSHPSSEHCARAVSTASPSSPRARWSRPPRPEPGIPAACPASCRVCSRNSSSRSRPPPSFSRSRRRPTRRSPRRSLMPPTSPSPATAPTTTSRPPSTPPATSRFAGAPIGKNDGNLVGHGQRRRRQRHDQPLRRRPRRFAHQRRGGRRHHRRRRQQGHDQRRRRQRPRDRASAATTSSTAATATT